MKTRIEVMLAALTELSMFRATCVILVQDWCPVAMDATCGAPPANSLTIFQMAYTS